jgi:hypothetical protein
MSKPLQLFEYERLKKDKIVEYYKNQQSDKTFSLDELNNFERKADKIIRELNRYYDREIDKNENK